MEGISEAGQTLTIETVRERNEWFHSPGVLEVYYVPGTRLALAEKALMAERHTAVRHYLAQHQLPLPPRL